MLDRLIPAFLALALAGPAGAACVEPAGCEERLTEMAESTQALMSAADAVEERGLLRGVGNIVVEPTQRDYQVTVADLPGASKADEAPPGVRVVVDRRTGRVLEVQAGAPGTRPYADVPKGALISGREAFDIALAALGNFTNYGKEGRLTVELVGKVYQVTFPLPNPPAGRGADYAAQVWVDAVSGRVVKVLVAS
jgi:hypothetical protein